MAARGAAPLNGGQLRFGNDFDGFLRLAEAARAAARDLPADTRHGIAPHSLRATTPEQLRALPAGGPVHMHVAEQVQEVDDVVAWLGARPVEWTLGELDVGPDWCLIHATHMSPGETTGLARSGAVAGLCPITEANLGDGIFNGPEFVAAGGVFGLGTDSNVRIALNEEIRQLEYSQRLRSGARNALLVEPGSTGAALYATALRAGAQATARFSGAIEVGRLADLVTLDADHAAFAGLAPDQLLDGWIFAAGDGVVRDVWSAGRHCVRDGRHVARDEIEASYRATLRDLTGRL